MNKNLHRIIFNSTRGQRMVVAETAGTGGKAVPLEYTTTSPRLLRALGRVGTQVP